MKCINCSNSHIIKNGRRTNGEQNYLCRSCNKQFSESQSKDKDFKTNHHNYWSRLFGDLHLIFI